MSFVPLSLYFHFQFEAMVKSKGVQQSKSNLLRQILNALDPDDKRLKQATQRYEHLIIEKIAEGDQKDNAEQRREQRKEAAEGHKDDAWKEPEAADFTMEVQKQPQEILQDALIMLKANLRDE